jgi:glycosyltransferase involved in cell wall biosynthesis
VQRQNRHKTKSKVVEQNSREAGPGGFAKGEEDLESLSKSCLSAVLITLNEEANIERCLRSLRGVDEVVIYDSGSTDRTLSLARDVAKLELPGTHLRIENGKWLGFGATKRLAVELAKNDWIFSIDADEVISTELMTELRTMMLLPDQLSPETGYCVPRKSRYLGSWIHHGGWYPDYQLRLFNRKFSNWDQAPVHEKVVAKSKAHLDGELFHYVFRDIEHQVQTNNRYSSCLLYTSPSPRDH